MCCGEAKEGCCHPEKKRDPQECSPEQIRECHGEAPEHPGEQQVQDQGPD
jgi:hypothetical protein